MNCIWNGSAEVEIVPGTSIEQACEAAIALATQIGGTVRFDFNSVPMRARKGDNPQRMAGQYHAALGYLADVERRERKARGGA